MKFTVRFPDAEIRGKLRRFRSDIQQREREVLEAIGVRVLSFSKQDYITKSRGGTGTDGIKWKPLEYETILAKNRRGKRNATRKTTKSGKPRPTMNQSAIGINTGLQLASASPGFAASGGGNILRLGRSSVTVGYGRSYSKYFDEVRPLLPSRLPETWRRACEEIVLRWALNLLKEAVSGR